MTYPNAALTDICRLLLDEWELAPEQIAALAKDIPGECAEMANKRDKAKPYLLAFAEKVRDFARELGDDGLYEDADAVIEKAEVA